MPFEDNVVCPGTGQKTLDAHLQGFSRCPYARWLQFIKNRIQSETTGLWSEFLKSYIENIMKMSEYVGIM